MKSIVLFLAVTMTACASTSMPKPMEPQVCFMNREGRMVHLMKRLDYGVAYQHDNDPVLEYLKFGSFHKQYKRADCPSTIVN